MTTRFVPWQCGRWLMVLAMACVAAAAQADGEPRPLQWRLMKQRPVSTAPASAPSLPIVPNGCALTDDQWTTWRESTIRYLLQLHKPTPEERKAGIYDSYLNRDEVSKVAPQVKTIPSPI